MPDHARSHDELDELGSRIDRWLDAQLEENPAYVAVDRGEPGERRWYVRLRGEEKDFTTVWLTLRQRMLHYETYVMPAPEEQTGELYEYLLRRNDDLVGAHFSIGAEDAVFLRGALPLDALDDDQLDRVIGSVLAFVERSFMTAVRIGFPRHFSNS
ncbi:MAG: YbjN domain-containing protein [Actinomycetota bacterium]